MQSFLNAGYTPQEVELAASKVNGAGVVTAPSVDQTQTSNPVNQIPQVQKLPKGPLVVEKKAPAWMIWLLVVGLGFVLAALGLVFYFKDSLF